MKDAKIGDKVVLVSEDDWSKEDGLKAGEIYTVARVGNVNIKVSEGLSVYVINKSQFKRVVTTVDVGTKVVRGKDWDWGAAQDAGSCYGVIVEKPSPTGWVTVNWISDTGRITAQYLYRIGSDGKYDLYYYDGPEVVAKPEPLVFDKYKIGDVVVSLTDFHSRRKEGEMFVVLPKSDKSCLYYKNDANSSDSSDWRAATPEEAAFFHIGGKNIKDMSKELLVFGKYKVGDIVVSLAEVTNVRKVGDMYTVLADSTPTNLSYDLAYCNHIPEQWRAATEFEAASYRTGTRNIKDIVSSATSSSVPSPNPSFESLEGKFVRCIVTKSSNHYIEGKYYYVDKHDKNFITIIDRFSAFRWMFGKSYDRVNNVYDLSKGYSFGEVNAFDIDYDAFKKQHVEKTIPKSELPFDVPVTAGSDVLNKISKPKDELKLISDFTTTQLKSRNKRTKLSIN
jgi:hypothetical protein